MSALAAAPALPPVAALAPPSVVVPVTVLKNSRFAGLPGSGLTVVLTRDFA